MPKIKSCDLIEQIKHELKLKHDLINELNEIRKEKEILENNNIKYRRICYERMVRK